MIARKYVAAAAAEGQWVLLQNTHLGLGYLTEVEQYLLKAEDLHEDFRLWITAEPHPQFPIGGLLEGEGVLAAAGLGSGSGRASCVASVLRAVLVLGFCDLLGCTW